ncbi:ATP-binding protein [Clostridium sp. 19966]|uniref:HD domain-containing protein n=1 Tax=Clostridium sp. 19966 TaxID=2768166 RepID=UPI0028E05C5B|nr:ATP-binding protein [Clostridium sp. 19966]MDT8717619.1 ATP-binding protein [Clostridium sp. 19966]
MDYSLEEHLKEICNNKNKYMNLYATWELDKKIYKNALIAIIYNYPHYSMHDHSHSETIINKIEMVLGEYGISQLGPTETWLMLQVAYLHDFGMLLQNTYIETEWCSAEFQKYLYNLKSDGSNINLAEAANYILTLNENIEELKESDKCWPVKIRNYVVQIISEYFRKKHAQLSNEWINNMQNWDLDISHNGLIPERLFNLAGEISLLHAKEFKDVLELNYSTNGIGNDIIHPRLIASMLRLGDLLDIDDGRFNPFVSKVFGKLPELSETHRIKHKSIKHILVTPEVIEAVADCSDEEVYRQTRDWFTWIKNEVENISINWTQIVPANFNKVPPRIGKLDVLWNHKKDINENINLKFEIAQKDAFEILEGTNIYHNKLAFIREYIQNAIDASKIQLWNDLKNGQYSNWIKDDKINQELAPYEVDEAILKNYKIIIDVNIKEVKIDDESDKYDLIEFIIRDRGTGISKKRLKSITNVAVSWDKRNDLEETFYDIPLWLKPTGTFGIGMQSAFSVCNEIQILTKSDGEECKEIRIISGRQNGYISAVEKKLNMPRGTQIRIQFDQQKKTTNVEKSYKYITEDSDPFKRRIDFRIDNIVKYIENIYNKDNGIIPISVMSQDKEIYHSDCCTSMYYEFKDSAQEGNYRYKFIYDNKLNKFPHCLIYDRETVSLIKIVFPSIKDRELRFSEPVLLYYKGIIVGNNSRRLNKNFLKMEWHIWGLAAKDMLTISRENIRENYIDSLNDYLNNLIKFSLIKLYNEMIENHDLLDYKDIDYLTIISLFKQYNINYKNLNIEDKCDNILYRVYCKDGDKYKINDIAEKDIIKEIENYLIYMPSFSREIFIYVNDDTVKKAICENLDKNGEFPKNGVIFDGFLPRILYHNYNIKIMSYLPANGENYIFYSFSPNYVEKVTYRDYTKYNILLYLITSRNIRSAIPAIEEYNCLKIKHTNQIGNIKTLGKNYTEKLDKIISPVNQEDIEFLINNKPSEYDFINYITNKEEFAEIVNYILSQRESNDLKDVEINKKNIKEKYIELTKYIYRRANKSLHNE